MGKRTGKNGKFLKRGGVYNGMEDKKTNQFRAFHIEEVGIEFNFLNKSWKGFMTWRTGWWTIPAG